MTSRRTLGPENNYERAGADLYRETRTGFVRLRDVLKSSASAGVLALAAVAVAVEPGTVDAVLPLSGLFAGWVLTRRVVLPLRLPITARRRDHNHPHPKDRRPRMAAGILYIGRDYRTLQELWISNEDGRQHIAVPGTTGAGKTAALVSLCANALGWGSGFIFVDGKADNRLYADVLALARRFGREDDVLVLNFLVASGGKHSHTFNPFAWGNADVIRELLVSQIESNPSGDKGGNHVFMQRAVALMGALTPVLVWMRDTHGVPIDIESIRFATELESIVSLAKDKVFRRRNTTSGVISEMPVPGIDEALLYPLRSYLGRKRRLRPVPARPQAALGRAGQAALLRSDALLGHLHPACRQLGPHLQVRDRRHRHARCRPQPPHPGGEPAGAGELRGDHARPGQARGGIPAQHDGANARRRPGGRLRRGDREQGAHRAHALPGRVRRGRLLPAGRRGQDARHGPRAGLHVLSRLPGAAWG